MKYWPPVKLSPESRVRMERLCAALYERLASIFDASNHLSHEDLRKPLFELFSALPTGRRLLDEVQRQDIPVKIGTPIGWDKVNENMFVLYTAEEDYDFVYVTRTADRYRHGKLTICDAQLFDALTALYQKKSMQKKTKSAYPVVPLVCRHCGREFLPTMQSQKYCAECRAAGLQRTAKAMRGNEYRYRNWQRLHNPEGVCQRCGKPVTGYAHFCKECRSAVLSEKHKKYREPKPKNNRHCKICGRDFFDYIAIHFCPDCLADKDKMRLWKLDRQWLSMKRKADEIRAKIAAREPLPQSLNVSLPPLPPV